MSKESKMLLKKLNNIKLSEPVKVESVSQNTEKLHNIIITDENNHKLNTPLFYSGDVGTKFKISYNKELVSDYILTNVNMLKSFISYIFYLKPDGTYIPIKECIVTDALLEEDNVVIEFVVGNDEEDNIRETHYFERQAIDNKKLMFIGKFK